jgi:hypothetical protein
MVSEHTVIDIDRAQIFPILAAQRADVQTRAQIPDQRRARLGGGGARQLLPDQRIARLDRAAGIDGIGVEELGLGRSGGRQPAAMPAAVISIVFTRMYILPRTGRAGAIL